MITHDPKTPLNVNIPVTLNVTSPLLLMPWAVVDNLDMSRASAALRSGEAAGQWRPWLRGAGVHGFVLSCLSHSMWCHISPHGQPTHDRDLHRTADGLSEEEG